MPTAAEAASGGNSQLQGVLDAGIAQISAHATVTFTLYNKAVVSDDGSVFWVATSTTLVVDGSLHYGTDRYQDEDQTIAVNDVILTSESEITAFNAVAPGTMWIGTWPADSGAIQVAFSRRGRYYQPSNVWHYSGHAVYPAMASQIIASAADLPTGPIVSNSLPIWLAQNTFAPVYPSFLVPDNIVPPYIAVHVEPQGTEALGNLPIYLWPGNAPSGDPLVLMASSQLCRDEVTLTLYGFTALTAQQYLSSLIDYSNVGRGETPTFGFANAPAIRDEKRVQVEIASVAQKKTIHISANYYQNTAEAIARRLILQAGISSFTVNAL